MLNRRLALALGAFALTSTLGVEAAEAGRRGWFRGGGGVRVSGGVSVGGSVHWSSRPRVWSPSRWSVGGSIYVGGYYQPRIRYYQPYSYYYAESYVPSYYGTAYYPVAPAPAPAVYAVAPARPELPKLGLGLFAGGVSVADVDESSDLGLLARLRLGNGGLLLEGELGKSEYANDLRVDRRLSASLVYEIGAHNRLAPYLVGGLGVQQADVAGQFETTQSFAEIGIGLRLAVTPRFHLAADVRAGSRDTLSSDADAQPVMSAVAREVSPPTTVEDENENYTRARLSALIYF